MKAALFLVLLTLFAAHSRAGAPSPIPIMILDGESNPWHDWRRTTPLLRRMLEETGLFRVEVVTAPPAGGDFTAFRPEFARYAAVVLNYDAPDGRWPQSLQRDFEQYMRDGGGLVVVHSANNAFPGWMAFNEMIGVGGWRERDEAAGPYWHVDEDGQLLTRRDSGPTGSHGRRIAFLVTLRAEHPVTRGLPESWLHAADELYAHLRGPGRNMTVLASAWSDPSNQGSGRHEPQLMALSFGQGRVFHTTLGHDASAMASVGFVLTFQRGTEWAATGQVSQSLPTVLPSQSAVRIREDLLAIDAAYAEHRQP